MKKTPVVKKGLTVAEEKRLMQAIQAFVLWLHKKKMLQHIPNIYTVDLPFSDDDWVMKFNAEKGQVSFNTLLRDRCSFDYYQNIIIHEFFHLAVQKVPNKEDAVKIKDDFGDQLMKLIDIEADFYTALFYKESLGYGLVQYLELYYTGSQVFSDKWIRIGKLERFIGTLLSICKMFINHPNKKSVVLCHDLYLPSISPLYTEDNLHVLVIRKEHIYLDFIKASLDDFVKLKDCYTNIDQLTFKGYIEKLIGFVTKALNLTLPQSIQNDISQIRK